MFNIGNFLKKAAVVAAVVAVNAVNNLVQQVTGGQGQIAQGFQAITNLVNRPFQKKDDDHPEDEPSNVNNVVPSGNGNQPTVKTSEPEKAEFSGNNPDEASDGDPPSLEGATLREMAKEYGLDIDQWLQGEPMSAELMVLAAGSSVMFKTLQMMRFEPNLLWTVLSHAPSIVHGLAILLAEAEVRDPETEAAGQLVGLVDNQQPNFAPGRGGGFGYRALPDSTQFINLLQQDTDDIEFEEDWQEYAYDKAIELGVDPVLLMMLITNEINHSQFDPFDHGDYGIMLRLANLFGSPGTWGLGQVAGFRGVEMLDKYPENFKEFESTYPPDIRNPDGSYSEYTVGHLLYTNDDFNLTVAATYVRDLETRIVADIQALGVTISDEPIPGTATITPRQAQQLVIVAYRVGWDGFSESLKDNEGPEDVARRVAITIELHSTHVANVLNLQTEIESLTGDELSPGPMSQPTQIP